MLEVRAGKALAFDFGAAANRVDATYFAGGEEHPLPVRPPGEAPSSRWLPEVPATLAPGGVEFSVLAFYDPPARPSGDQHWEVTGRVLRPLRTTGRVRVPRVRGLAVPAAKAALERRGLRWRVDGGAVESDSGPVDIGTAPAVHSQRPRAGRGARRGTVTGLTTG